MLRIIFKEKLHFNMKNIPFPGKNYYQFISWFRIDSNWGYGAQNVENGILFNVQREYPRSTEMILS